MNVLGKGVERASGRDAIENQGILSPAPPLWF